MTTIEVDIDLLPSNAENAPKNARLVASAIAEVINDLPAPDCVTGLATVLSYYVSRIHPRNRDSFWEHVREIADAAVASAEEVARRRGRPQ